jgi:hypothetical protein
LSVLALIIYIGHRWPSAHAQQQSDDAPPAHAQQQADSAGWSLIASPYGPGVWLTDTHRVDVAYAFIPPGARGSQDESDSQRQIWRHLTVDSDLSNQPTVTILDTHEVYTRVPEHWRRWVMEQSLRYADGEVRGADLLQSVVAMGVRPDQLDDALRLLGGSEKLGIQHVCRAARSFATPAQSARVGLRGLVTLANIAAKRASRIGCPQGNEDSAEARRCSATDEVDLWGQMALPLRHC